MPVFDFVKSSYSTASDECVEIAINVPGTVAIRDSKTPSGPTLHVTPAAWAAFREAIVQEDAA
ncbi:DUF397 domain-containing protein [Streptomyces varsoviensis]|uniref:DUF397 domain-containing protein n=1 Tax=Streptomyces varsoviensis TaxID=67373 RepID=A0ABR5IXI4_9ACTN|nr:DUF397 domain-containing protein [Streptomyces varsoviensis]KOG85878.1 hypothetical protein ADK38_34220 [Streptomyces varsoviensis]